MNRTYRTPRPARAQASSLLCFGVAVLVAVAVPAPTCADAVVREVIASAEPCLNLQPEPDSSTRPIRCLAPGEQMNLLQSQDGWALVRLADGLRGWVEFALIRPVEEARLTRVSTGKEASSPAARRIAELEAKLASIEAERAQLQRGTSALRGEIYEIRLANDRLLASAANRLGERSEAEERTAELEAELAEAETRRELTAEEALEREARIAALEAEVVAGARSEDQILKRLAASERLLAEAEAERLDAVVELEALRLENQTLQSRLAAEREELEQGAAQLQNQLGELRADQERLELVAAELADSNSVAVARSETLEEALASVETRFATLEQALAATEGDRLELEQSNSELRGEIDALRSENERLASGVAAAMAPSVSSIERERMPGDLDLFEKALGVTEAERLALEQSLAAVQSEVAAERSKVEDLNARLAAAEMFLTASEDQRIENARQIEVLREELERLEAPVETPRVDLAGAGPGEFSGASADAESELAASGNAEESLEESVASPSSFPTSAGPNAAAGEWTAVVEAWAKAWSEQRVEDYLYFYSPSFEPPDGSSRSQWEALRRERITGPESIDVRVALADLRPQGEDRVEVVFLQSYESDRMTDVVLKTLELVFEDGLWKIAAERVE